MGTRFVRVAVAALLQFLLIFHQGASAQSVRITNLKNGEMLRYPVALISGEVNLPDGAPLSLHNDSSANASKRATIFQLRSWAVASRRSWNWCQATTCSLFKARWGAVPSDCAPRR